MNVNYQLKLEEIIKDLKPNKNKLLLHSCCAPCSSYVLTYLLPYFDITVLYYNPNIMPKKEYDKRKAEQIKLLKILNIKIKDIDYDDSSFMSLVQGLEKEKEGGIRCHKCYQLRLEKTAELAQSNYDYFGTTLTISPYKDSLVINKIGELLEKKYKINYLYSDFKKKEGYKKSILLSKKYNLYRQNYCGCKLDN